MGVVDGGFFGTFLVLIDVNLMMPWLLNQLTDIRAIVNLAPTIATVGASLPQLFAARLVQTNPYRRPYLFFFSGLRIFTLLLILPFLFFDLAGPQGTLIAVLGFFTLSSFMVGFTALPWQEMIAKIIPSKRLSSFFGLRSFLGGLISLGVAGFIHGFLGATQTVPLPKFGVLIGLGAIAMLGATLSNVFIREPAGLIRQSDRPLLRQFKDAARISWAYLPFRRYLFVRALLLLIALTGPLYIVEGRTRYGLLAESIGSFAMGSVIAGIAASLLWSFLGDRLGLVRLCRIVAALSLGPPLVALLMPLIVTTSIGAYGGWMIVFMLFGAAQTGQQNVNFRGVIELSLPAERGQMIAFGNTFSGLASLFGPLIGLSADIFGSSAAFGAAVLASVLVIGLTTRLQATPSLAAAD